MPLPFVSFTRKEEARKRIPSGDPVLGADLRLLSLALRSGTRNIFARVMVKGEAKEPFWKRMSEEAEVFASIRFVYAKGKVKEPFKERRGEEAVVIASIRFVYGKSRVKGTVFEAEAERKRKSSPPFVSFTRK